jgi:glutamate 5-kinase
MEADLLVMLTDQPGLFTADPRKVPSAQLVRDVHGPEIPETLWQMAGGSPGRQGTGGMITKLQAADLARRSGVTVIIARGSDPDVLLRLGGGEAIGTRFDAVDSALESRKRFLLAGGRARDRLVVDEGARQALRAGGSLLPVGLAAVEGSFKRGDPVRVLDQQGREIARGLANYSAADMRRISGRHSSEIEKILGFVYGEEVIHRNNLVLL